MRRFSVMICHFVQLCTMRVSIRYVWGESGEGGLREGGRELSKRHGTIIREGIRGQASEEGIT